MSHKKSVWIKIATLALVVAPVITNGGASMVFWGEPKLPKHINKK